MNTIFEAVAEWASGAGVSVDNIVRHPYAVWTVIVSQGLLGRAREIAVADKTKDVLHLEQEERKKNKEFAETVVGGLENGLWAGLDEMQHDLFNRGIKRMDVKRGHGHFNMSVADVCRDIHHAIGRESKNVRDMMLSKVNEEVERLSLFSEALGEKEAKEESTKAIAKGIHSFFIERISKRAGYNDETKKMLSKYASVDTFNGMVSEVFGEAEILRAMRDQKNKSVEKQYSINILSIIKIVGTIFGRRRKRR